MFFFFSFRTWGIPPGSWVAGSWSSGARPQNVDLNRPWVLPLGTQLVYQGSVVHLSHHLAWQRGILYCLRCGYLCHKKVDKLALPCVLKPPTTKQAGVLKRLKAGMSPTPGKDFPSPVGNAAPVELQAYLDYEAMTAPDP